MSAKLGVLTLDLVAKVGSFTEGIKSAEKQTSKSFSSMKDSVKKYGAVVATVTASATVAVGAMALSYTNAAAEIQNFSAISMASTTEFQLQAAGAQAVGLTMEQLANQYKDFNEKLGEFITIGAGGAVDFFEQIAIKTEGSAEGARKLALEMQKLSGPEAMQLYVDKLEEAGVSQQQMSFYLESMASDTTKLIPLLKNGGEGFEFWADAARDAGLIMDEYAIKRAAELKVQMTLLNMQVQGAKNQFIQGLMPALISVGGAFSEATGKTDLMAEAGATLGEVLKGVGAVALGVYASVKMLSNAIAGLAFDAANAKRTVDKAAEGGSIWDRLPGIRFGKTILQSAIMSKAEGSGASMAAADNRKLADDISASIETLYSDTVDKAVKKMAELNQAQAGVIAGSDEWVKKQNEAAEKTAQTANAELEKIEQLEQKRNDIRNKYAYEFADDDWKRLIDYNTRVAEITDAFQGDELLRYLKTAKNRYDQEQKLASMQFEWELAEHQLNEEQKLRLSYNIKEQEIIASTKLTDKQKNLKLEVLKEQFDQEFRIFSASQHKQLLETKQGWMSAAEYAREYYKIVRFEILNTPSYSPDLKNALVQQANADQGIAENADREQLWADYQSQFEDQESPEEMRQRLLEETFAQSLITEEKYHLERSKLHAAWGQDYFANTASVLRSVLGEESVFYQAAFAMQKAYAVSQVALNAPQTYSNVYKNASALPVVGPYVAPVMAGAAVALQMAQAATVGSVSFTGMAHDGIDNIPKEGTWLLAKGERVVDNRTNADLKNYLKNANHNQGMNIVINNQAAGVDVVARQDNNGVTFDIVDRYVAQALATRNSYADKAMRSNYNVKVNR